MTEKITDVILQAMDDSLKEQNKESPSSAEADFLGYITSLAFQAMVFLGEIQNPLNGKVEKNIPHAKLIIDTLILLREKTKGNLSDQESHLLEASIYELQLKYVENLGDEKKNG
ncbi:MAG: DUF1844 domain-containing protein [Candidatus Omnitrophica bacterium]|nr:DUF1844 domain-containing protein [Candidatus Omnitrophota bacterium]